MATKNAPTIDQLKIACRHVIELMDAGVSENLAIRTLELFANNYAKVRVVGHVSPDHVSQYTLWSKAARKIKAANPKGAYSQYLRVEHGTPRRSFARLVLVAYKKGKLTKRWMDSHCKKQWKCAVITREEDLRLNKIARAKPFASPDKRWAAAKIDF